MKLIIVANMNTKLFSWMFIFRKVVRQHTWGEVLVLIQASSTEPFWTNSEEMMKIGPLLPKLLKSDLLFLWDAGYIVLIQLHGSDKICDAQVVS